VHEFAAIPLRALLDVGVPVAIGTDDPLMFGVGLAGQYAICGDVLGLSDAEVAGLAAASIRHSAAPNHLKRELLLGAESWLRNSAVSQ
jgi:adenosine deaminase